MAHLDKRANLVLKILVTVSLPLGLLLILFLEKTNPETVFAWLEGFFASYGYVAVFVGALCEALVFVNVGVPGGTAVLLGASFAGGDRALTIPGVVLAGTVGAVCGYVVDYWYGREGYAPEKYALGLRRLSTKIRWQYLVAGFAVHPNALSYLVVLLGQMRVRPVGLFGLIVLFQMGWIFGWTYLASFYGRDLVRAILSMGPGVLLAVLLIWIVWEVVVWWKGRLLSGR